jgi:Toprim-like
MATIMTRKGKSVEVVSEGELRGPIVQGEYVRAFCHIHGSDHQRSLSIQRRSGWGHCFNAACNALVLVREWNASVAARLLGETDAHEAWPLRTKEERLPIAMQPVLLHLPPVVQPWQHEEMETLQALYHHAQSSLLVSRRAQAYLEGRGIAGELAWQSGVAYVAPEIVPGMRRREERALARRWAARLLFPLTSPGGSGYIGRSLWRWQPGMNENTHKKLLDEAQGVKRWIKSNPAGWFAPPLEQLARSIIVVEGAFDRLTLMSAGFAANEVVALAGTAMQAEWLPGQVKTIVLALDGDEGGDAASARLAEQLGVEGFEVKQCQPPRDRWGKDWNERWHRIGYESIWPLRDACSTLRSA